MSNLAEMIKQRSAEAYESLLEPETQRQWHEVMSQIEEAANRGADGITWHESGEYMANWRDRVKSTAVNMVLKKLEAEGFRVFTERRAGRGLGAIINW